MRYVVTQQQLDSFKTEQTLLLEGLYTEEEAKVINEEIEKVLPQSSAPNLALGRDLQRLSPPLLSTLNPSRLGQIAYEVFKKKPLRIAYTQVLPCFKGKQTLLDISCFTEIVGGMLLQSDPSAQVFYTPTFEIDFDSLEDGALLVVFAKIRMRYTLAKGDPHTHFFKKLGYAFGDQISSQTHPLITK